MATKPRSTAVRRFTMALLLGLSFAKPGTLCRAAPAVRCWRLTADHGTRWSPYSPEEHRAPQDGLYSPVTALAQGHDTFIAAELSTGGARAGSAIFRLSGGDWQWDYGFLGPSAPTFRALCVDTHGQLWAGHSNGLSVRGSTSWLSVAGYYRENVGTLGGGMLSQDDEFARVGGVVSISAASDGTVWAVHDQGHPVSLPCDWIALRQPMPCRNPSSPLFAQWREVGVPQVALFDAARDGVLWAVRKDWACLKLAGKSEWQMVVPPPRSPPSGKPTALHPDASGTIWAASESAERCEILRCVGGRWLPAPDVTAACANRRVGSIAENSRGVLFFAADGAGVITLDHERAVVHPVTSLLPTIAGAQRSKVLLRGLWNELPDERRRALRACLDAAKPNVPVGAVAVAPDDALWVGGNGMVVRWMGPEASETLSDIADAPGRENTDG